MGKEIIEFELRTSLLYLLQNIRNFIQFNKSFEENNTHTPESEAFQIRTMDDRIWHLEQIIVDKKLEFKPEDTKCYNELFSKSEELKEPKLVWMQRVIDAFIELKDYSMDLFDFLNRFEVPIDCIQAENLIGRQNLKDLILDELKRGNTNIDVYLRY